MKPIFRTTRFDKDVKRMVKRGKSLVVFKSVITQLANDQLLATKYKDHKLVGEYTGVRECHIEPDWLLLYISEADALTLIRTGTHSDLFR
jgi:mRNA interferase YafQ